MAEKARKEVSFARWDDAAREAFMVSLGRGTRCPISARTWRRWRQRARAGDLPYQEFCQDISRRLRHFWTSL